jgi:hypothetical protein
MNKPFEKWFTEELELTFGIQRKVVLPPLTNWLTNNVEVSEQEQQAIKTLQTAYIAERELWNEQELESIFIIPLIQLVRYGDNKNYRFFLERKLTAKVQNETLNGNVDFMLAEGRQLPRNPFFCIHEYKTSKKSDNDPQGQLLAAMLTAQAKNTNKDNPIYGCVVVQDLWKFVVLQHSHYAVSTNFDAAKNDIFDIFKLLKYIKHYIEAQYSTNNE